MHKDATIDATQRYRYTLDRWWGSDKSNVVNFILLNPSTADAFKDDRTVLACIEFARRWKFDGLIITNLFAFRATDPTEMISCRNPHGSNNDRYITRVAKRSRMVVVAWGNHGTHCNRDKEVLKLLSSIKQPFCLGVTASGNPKHPLYVNRTTKPRRLL